MTLANISTVQKVGDGKDSQRIRAHTDEVSDILNSLLLNGSITRTGPTSFTIPGTGGGGINAWEHPFAKPTVAALSFINDTGFTHTDDTNGVFLWNGTPAAADNLCLAQNAIPVGAWSDTIRIQSLWGDDGFAQGGAHLYETSTGKIITWGCQGTSGGQRLCINQFTNVTTFSSQAKTIPMTERPNWLRISYDGAVNYTFYWSMDGYSWVQYGGNLPQASFFTTGASHAGFFLDPNSAAIITGIKCMSFTLQ